ncbi:MAG: hypothetical protein Q8O72_09560 [Bacteroidales bacterium]|nr:hypothetical protein [Bacteroidales bacterium]
MNRLFQVITFLVIFQLTMLQTFAQDVAAVNKKNHLTFNITRLILLEARVGYERQLSEKDALRTSIGIQFPVSATSFGHIPSADVFYEIPLYYAVSKGVYFSVGYNYLVLPSSHIYLSAEVYTNFSYYDKKVYKFCVSEQHSSYASLQSQDLRKTGLKFIIGKKTSIRKSAKSILQFDLFSGIGIQYRQEETNIFKRVDGYCDIDYPHNVTLYDPPKKEISDRWYPTFHLGVLIDFPF